MLQSIIHGKLPSSVWNSEDVVTSSIIGGFEYLSDPKYIVKALSASMDLSGKQLIFTEQLKHVCYLFWPALKQAEPDAWIVLADKPAHCLYGSEI